MTSRAAHENRVLRLWADWFGCEVDLLGEPGYLIAPHERYDDLNGVFLWYLGRHVCIECSPALEGRVRVALAEGADGGADAGRVDGHRFDGLWEGPARHERDSIAYLHAPDLCLHEPPKGYDVRVMDVTHDADQLAFDEFVAACPQEDRDEAIVGIEDETIVGAFEGARLRAVASVYERTGFLDFGSLTLPDVRGQGLGKAVVSALASWCLDRGVIPQ